MSHFLEYFRRRPLRRLRRGDRCRRHGGINSGFDVGVGIAVIDAYVNGDIFCMKERNR